MSPEETVHAYLAAVEARDFALARNFLADRGFLYHSPVSDFTDADAFIAVIEKIGPILERIECRRTFAAGNEVCSILRFVTSWSAPRLTDVVQWTTVVDGRITCMEIFFDGRAYREMFAND